MLQLQNDMELVLAGNDTHRNPSVTFLDLFSRISSSGVCDWNSVQMNGRKLKIGSHSQLTPVLSIQLEVF